MTCAMQMDFGPHVTFVSGSLHASVVLTSYGVCDA